MSWASCRRLLSGRSTRNQLPFVLPFRPVPLLRLAVPVGIPTCIDMRSLGTKGCMRMAWKTTTVIFTFANHVTTMRGTAVLILSLILRVEASGLPPVSSSAYGSEAAGWAPSETHDVFSSDNARSMNNDGNRMRTRTSNPTGGIVQPLLPHHALLERRRRELRSLGLSSEEAEAEMTNLRRDLRADAADRPHTYPRKRAVEIETTASGEQEEQRSLADIEHQQIGALYQGYGTHYVDVWVGTPPQRQTVIVDTGSGVTAFPCASCNNCGESYHTDGYFVEADSSTFQKLDCDSPCFRGRCSGSGSTQICRISMSYQVRDTVLPSSVCYGRNSYSRVSHHSNRFFFLIFST